MLHIHPPFLHPNYRNFLVFLLLCILLMRGCFGATVPALRECAWASPLSAPAQRVRGCYRATVSKRGRPVASAGEAAASWTLFRHRFGRHCPGRRCCLASLPHERHATASAMDVDKQLALPAVAALNPIPCPCCFTSASTVNATITTPLSITLNLWVTPGGWDPAFALLPRG